MKKLLYILTAVFLFTSCRSIDKMVESGNYDQALQYGVDKLIGKKNKKTKYVRGLEKAYAKLNNRDLAEIKKLKLKNSGNSLERVVQVYERMARRQNIVIPLLPLVSKDGYEATLLTREYANIIHDSKLSATEAHYTRANEIFEIAIKNQDKLAARRAFNAFREAQTYFDSYKDTDVKRSQAYDQGQTYILVEPYTAGSNVVYDHTEEILSLINTKRISNTWNKYHTVENQNLTYSYIATIEVNDINPGKERERYNSYTETKDIVDGKTEVRDINGHVVKDTSGNVIYTDNKISVTAYIEEVTREKYAHMGGKIVIVDATNNEHINTTPLNITHNFEDYSCIFRGDKRALSGRIQKRVKSVCGPFPSDYKMTSDLAYTYKEEAEKLLMRQRLI